MRRTVATLLVFASSLLLATPVSEAAGDRLPTTTLLPTVVSVAPAVGAPAAVPAPPAPVAVETPAAPAPVRRAVTPARARARAAVAEVTDSIYSAKLQAELCAARQIFCGLDRGGRYPGR